MTIHPNLTMTMNVTGLPEYASDCNRIAHAALQASSHLQRGPQRIVIGRRSRFMGPSQNFVGTSCIVILRTAERFSAERLLLAVQEKTVRPMRRNHAWYTHRGPNAGLRVSLSHLWGSIVNQWVVDSVRIGPQENLMVSGIPLCAFSPGAIHDGYSPGLTGTDHEIRVTLRRLPCRAPVLVIGRRGARATRLFHEPRVACALVSMQGMVYPS